MTKRSFTILYNPAAAAGRSRKLLPEVERSLNKLGADYELVGTASLDDAREKAGTASRSDRVVVSMGGDGVLGALAGVVAGEGGLIGIIPAGRGNDFARMLGLPKRVDQVCKLLVEGEETSVDMGEVNGIPFLGIASTGLDSDANRYANKSRIFRGQLSYAYGGIRAVIGWKPAIFTITADGESWSFEGYSVAVANSRYYGGGMKMAPDADLRDGLFDIVTIAAAPKLRLLMSMPKLFKGTHISVEGVSVRRAATVELKADRPFTVYADGDELTELPATVKIRPSALRVITPQGV